jgi:hypothetical protein
MAAAVHFDKQLQQLDPGDEAAWRAWLTQHQLHHMLIACPSTLTYQEPTRRKPAQITVELLTRDPRGVARSRRTVCFSDRPLPFPGGYRIKML